MDAATRHRHRPRRQPALAPRLRKWKADELQMLIQVAFPALDVPIPPAVRQPNSAGYCEALLITILEDPDQPETARKLYKDYLRPYQCFRDVYKGASGRAGREKETVERSERDRDAAAQSQRAALAVRDADDAPVLLLQTDAPAAAAPHVEVLPPPIRPFSTADDACMPQQLSALDFLSTGDGAPPMPKPPLLPLCALPAFADMPSPPPPLTVAVELRLPRAAAQQLLDTVPSFEAPVLARDFIHLPRTVERRFLSTYPEDVAARMLIVASNILYNRCAMALTPSGMLKAFEARSEEWRLEFEYDAATGTKIPRMDLFTVALFCKQHGVMYKDLVTFPEAAAELAERASKRIAHTLETWRAADDTGVLNGRRLFFITATYKDWFCQRGRRLYFADWWPVVHLVNVYRIIVGEDLFVSGAEMRTYIQLPALFEHVNPERVGLEAWEMP